MGTNFCNCNDSKEINKEINYTFKNDNQVIDNIIRKSNDLIQSIPQNNYLESIYSLHNSQFDYTQKTQSFKDLDYNNNQFYYLSNSKNNSPINENNQISYNLSKDYISFQNNNIVKNSNDDINKQQLLDNNNDNNKINKLLDDTDKKDIFIDDTNKSISDIPILPLRNKEKISESETELKTINIKYGIYKGETNNNKANGVGILSGKNNSTGKGYFKDNEFDGYIILNCKESTYEGEAKEGKYEGIGLETFKDGNAYLGEYKNNLKEGVGVYTWANGSKYLGEIKANKIEGYGIYIFPDGRIYEGEFINNEFNGIGFLKWNDQKNILVRFKMIKEMDLAYFILIINIMLVFLKMENLVDMVN